MHRGKRRELTHLALVGIASSLAACSASPAAERVPAVPVVTAVVQRGNQPVTLGAPGQLQGYYTVDARAQTSGRITRLFYAEGQTVKAGQPLAQIDPRPLQAALEADRAQLARDSAALDGARDLLERNAPLVSQGLASAQQVAAYRTQVAQLAATVAGDRAVLTRDRLSLAYTTIRSPISGVAGLRKADPGALVGPSDAAGIVTVAQVQPIAMLFSVSQKDLDAIQRAVVGSRTNLKVAVTTQGDGRPVLESGELVVLNNQIDPATGTVLLKAVLPNADRKLWPGQLVHAQLELGIRPGVITIPSSAVQRNPQATFVWLVSNGHARMQPIKAGASTGDRTIVTAGLVGGETVVTDGQFALTPGAVVTAQANPASATVRSDDPHRLGIVQ
jgi:multidrug efflux system membrane fusion protein